MSFQNGTKVRKNVCCIWIWVTQMCSLSSLWCFHVSNTIQPCISFVIVGKRIERNVLSGEINCVEQTVFVSLPARKSKQNWKVEYTAM